MVLDFSLAASIFKILIIWFLLGLIVSKIPSGEITNLPYLRHVGGFGKPIILSTGMATLGEIEAALDVLNHQVHHEGKSLCFIATLNIQPQ